MVKSLEEFLLDIPEGAIVKVGEGESPSPTLVVASTAPLLEGPIVTASWPDDDDDEDDEELIGAPKKK